MDVLFYIFAVIIINDGELKREDQTYLIVCKIFECESTHFTVLGYVSYEMAG